jgi:hypothetical protein
MFHPKAILGILGRYPRIQDAFRVEVETDIHDRSLRAWDLFMGEVMDLLLQERPLVAMEALWRRHLAIRRSGGVMQSFTEHTAVYDLNPRSDRGHIDAGQDLLALQLERMRFNRHDRRSTGTPSSSPSL